MTAVANGWQVESCDNTSEVQMLRPPIPSRGSWLPILIQPGNAAIDGGKCASCGAELRKEVCGECLAMESWTRHCRRRGTVLLLSRPPAPKGWDLPYVLGMCWICPRVFGSSVILRVPWISFASTATYSSAWARQDVRNVLMSFIFKPGEGVPK